MDPWHAKKIFVNRFGDETTRLLRQIQLRDTPYRDSWKEGQRVARLTANNSAWAAGQDRGNIGDRGTVVRFLQRKDEPEHALYLVKWDSYPWNTAYATHSTAQAVTESARDVIEALNPKQVMRQFGRKRIWHFRVFNMDRLAFESDDGDYVLHVIRLKDGRAWNGQGLAPNQWQASLFDRSTGAVPARMDFEAETRTVAADTAKAWANRKL